MKEMTQNEINHAITLLADWFECSVLDFTIHNGSLSLVSSIRSHLTPISDLAAYLRNTGHPRNRLSRFMHMWPENWDIQDATVIVRGDAPDFPDSFVSRCMIGDREATNEELDEINDDSELVYGLVQKHFGW